jgi:hypothetical protein
LFTDHPQAYFCAAATAIQRRWRGYWSRKHIHSFAARKAYLSAVAQQNAAVRLEMATALEAELLRRAGGRRETARELFERQIGQLHHLVSTKSVPGIFSPPFEGAAGLLPVIEGQTVEEHLQRACRAQVRRSGAAKPWTSYAGTGLRAWLQFIVQRLPA